MALPLRPGPPAKRCIPCRTKRPLASWKKADESRKCACGTRLVGKRRSCAACSRGKRRAKLVAKRPEAARAVFDFTLRPDPERWVANAAWMVYRQTRPTRRVPAEFIVVHGRNAVLPPGPEHWAHAVLRQFIGAPATLRLALDATPDRVTEDGYLLADLRDIHGQIPGEAIEMVRDALSGRGLFFRPARAGFNLWGARFVIDGGAQSVRVNPCAAVADITAADSEPRVDGRTLDIVRARQAYLRHFSDRSVTLD